MDIMGVRVEILPIRRSRFVPQCKRCQAEHTQKYCSKEHRYCKCTDKHLTVACQKSAIAQPKSLHCGEGHPGNFRGWISSIAMQKLRTKQKKKKHGSQQSQRNQQKAMLPTQQNNSTQMHNL